MWILMNSQVPSRHKYPQSSENPCSLFVDIIMPPAIYLFLCCQMGNQLKASNFNVTLNYFIFFPLKPRLAEKLQSH